MTTIAPSAGLLVGTVLAVASWAIVGYMVVRWARPPRKFRSR